MPTQTPYERVDRYLATLLGPLNTRISTMRKMGAGKDTTLAVAKASAISHILINASTLGAKIGTPEYAYAVDQAAIIANGMVDWEYDPEHVMPPEIAALADKPRPSGTTSKSISRKVGAALGGGAYVSGQYVGGAIEKGERVVGGAIQKGGQFAGKWIGKVAEYI